MHIYEMKQREFCAFSQSMSIWQCHKQLAKNTEKCVTDSFFKAEDDPTQIEQFI